MKPGRPGPGESRGWRQYSPALRAGLGCEGAQGRGEGVGGSRLRYAGAAVEDARGQGRARPGGVPRVGQQGSPRSTRSVRRRIISRGIEHQRSQPVGERQPPPARGRASIAEPIGRHHDPVTRWVISASAGDTGLSGEGSKVGAARPASAGAGLILLASPDCPGRGAGSWARTGCAVAPALGAFEPARRGAVAPGFVAGSRFKGSVRNGLNGTVEPDFAVGSRFKGSVRNDLNGTVGADFGTGSRFKGSIRDGVNGVAEPGVGVFCGGRLAEGARGTWTW